MATKSFSRNALYMTFIGYALYAVAGLVLWQNAKFTVDAFVGVGIPRALCYIATAFICIVESATAIFLLTPSTWGEVSRDLREESASAVGHFSGSTRIAAAIVAAMLTALMLALVVATYIIDWKSTAAGLGLSLSNIGSQEYKALLTAILVFGPEVSSILGFQVLRRAREAEILQNEEDSRLDPARIYSNELKRQRIKQAKATARQTNWNPESR